MPTTEQLQTLLTRIITRLRKMFTRHGALMEEDTEIPYLTNPDHDPALAPLHAAACTYCLAFGPRAGQKVLTWKDPSLRLASQKAPQSQGCVSAQGFSLHADTRCWPPAAAATRTIVPLHYASGPGPQRTPAGEVVLQLKTPCRNSAVGVIIRNFTYYSHSKN